MQKLTKIKYIHTINKLIINQLRVNFCHILPTKAKTKKLTMFVKTGNICILQRERERVRETMKYRIKNFLNKTLIITSFLLKLTEEKKPKPTPFYFPH